MKSIKLLCCAMLASAFLSVPFQANSAINNANVNSPYVRQYAGEQADNTSNHRSWFKKKARLVVQDEPKNDPFAIFSLIAAVASIIGIFYLLGIIITVPAFILFFIPISILFSIISLVRIKKHPEKWKGKKMAIWALMIVALPFAAFLGLIIYFLDNLKM